MARLRFTILNLLCVIGFSALALAALRQATDLLDSAVFTLALGILILAPLLAIYRARRKRAYWVGFAVCGSLYLVATLIPAIEPRLLTTHGLKYLDTKRQALPQPTTGAVYADFDSDGALDLFVANVQAPSGSVNWNQSYFDLSSGLAAGSAKSSSNGQFTFLTPANSSGWRRVLLTRSGSTEAFVHIGHALCALVLAYLGGRLTARLWRQRHPQAV